MDMRVGMPYRVDNEVVEFEEDRRIAWRHMGHHVWRYELEPVAEGTRVTETFDWAHSRAPWALELMRAPQRNRKSMESTLVAPRSGGRELTRHLGAIRIAPSRRIVSPFR